MWSQNDGRCLMQNPTGLKPTGMIKISDYILTWGKNSSFSVFHASSLELIQTVSLPEEEAWINQIIHINKGSEEIADCKVLCLLDNGSVWQYDFNELNGKISSCGKYIQDYPKEISILNQHEGELYMLTKNCICFYDLNNVKFIVHSSKNLNAKVKLADIEIFHPLDSKTLLLSTINGETFILSDDGQSHHHRVLDNNQHIACKQGSFLLVFADNCIHSLVEIKSLNCVEKNEFPASLLFSTSLSTTSSLSSDGTLALGFNSGIAKVGQFSDFIVQDTKEVISFTPDTEANSGKITAVLIIKNFLVTGDCEGQIKFWNCLTCSLAYTYKFHVKEIITFLELKKGSEMESELVAVSQDGSVSIFQVKHAVSKRYSIIPRLGHKITKVQWASPFDDFILIEYSDQTSHLWNLKNGAFEKEYHPGNAEFTEIKQIFKHHHKITDDSSSFSQPFLEAILVNSASSSFDIDLRKLMRCSILIEHGKAENDVSNRLERLVLGLLCAMAPKSMQKSLSVEFLKVGKFSCGVYG